MTAPQTKYEVIGIFMTGGDPWDSPYCRTIYFAADIFLQTNSLKLAKRLWKKPPLIAARDYANVLIVVIKDGKRTAFRSSKTQFLEIKEGDLLEKWVAYYETTTLVKDYSNDENN